MSTAVKVWARDEPKPEGNVAHYTGAPPNWFKEEPKYAAELYGLERGEGAYTINVLDDEGAHYEFKVKVRLELQAIVGPPRMIP